MLRMYTRFVQVKVLEIAQESLNRDSTFKNDFFQIDIEMLDQTHFKLFTKRRLNQ